MAKVIAVANNKGGVGKTTTSISLAALFADWNLRVALIDNDPQGNIGIYLGRYVFDNHHTIADMYNGQSLKKIGTHTLYQEIAAKHQFTFKRENLTVFLANHNLAFVAEDFHRIGKLNEALEEIKNDYDVIVIDNGPYIGYLTRAALLAADLVLIPTEAGAGGLAGIPQIIKETESINARHWRQVMIRVFVNNFQHKEEFDVSNLQKLKSMVGSRLYNTFIPSNVHLRKSKELGLPIHMIDKAAKTPVQGAMAFRILAKNILKDILPDYLVPRAPKSAPAPVKRLGTIYHPLPPHIKKPAVKDGLAAPETPAPTAPQAPATPPPQVPAGPELPRIKIPSYALPMETPHSQESRAFGHLEPNPISTANGNTAYASRVIGRSFESDN